MWAPGGRPRVVFGVTIAGGRIIGIDLFADPEQLGPLDVAILDNRRAGESYRAVYD